MADAKESQWGVIGRMQNQLSKDSSMAMAGRLHRQTRLEMWKTQQRLQNSTKTAKTKPGSGNRRMGPGENWEGTGRELDGNRTGTGRELDGNSGTHLWG